MVIFRKKTLQTVLLSSSTISFKYFPVFRLECLHDFDQIDTSNLLLFKFVSKYCQTNIILC